MNVPLVLSVGVALLLLNEKLKPYAWARWLSWGVALALLVQPAIAVLKWAGGLVGV